MPPSTRSVFRRQSCDARLGSRAGKEQLLALRRFILAAHAFSRQPQLAAVAAGGDRRNGPVPFASLEIANSGWARTASKLGAGRQQLDFDHPVGHRDHVLDRSGAVPERSGFLRQAAV